MFLTSFRNNIRDRIINKNFLKRHFYTDGFQALKQKQLETSQWVLDSIAHRSKLESNF